MVERTTVSSVTLTKQEFLTAINNYMKENNIATVTPTTSFLVTDTELQALDSGSNTPVIKVSWNI